MTIITCCSFYLGGVPVLEILSFDEVVLVHSNENWTLAIHGNDQCNTTVILGLQVTGVYVSINE